MNLKNCSASCTKRQRLSCNSEWEEMVSARFGKTGGLLEEMAFELSIEG